jgi:hypothetical protein
MTRLRWPVATFGHANVYTTQQYLYVADEEVQAAVRAIGIRRDELSALIARSAVAAV